MVSKVKAKKKAPVKKSAAKTSKKAAPIARKGRTSTSTLSAKNQLTVPVDILRALGISAGAKMEFEINASGAIEIKPVAKPSGHKILGLIGIAYGEYKDFDLRAERDAWGD